MGKGRLEAPEKGWCGGSSGPPRALEKAETENRGTGKGESRRRGWPGQDASSAPAEGTATSGGGRSTWINEKPRSGSSTRPGDTKDSRAYGAGTRAQFQPGAPLPNPQTPSPESSKGWATAARRWASHCASPGRSLGERPWPSGSGLRVGGSRRPGGRPGGGPALKRRGPFCERLRPQLGSQDSGSAP